MKTDLYTKAVLTVIALALSVIAVRSSLPSAFAQNGGIQKVVICDSLYSEVQCARVSGYALRVTN